jgi:hypothetical protein
VKAPRENLLVREIRFLEPQFRGQVLERAGFVRSVPVPRRGGQSARIDAVNAFRGPRVDECLERRRKVTAHVDDPAYEVGVAGAGCQARPEGGISACAADDVLLGLVGGGEVFDFVCKASLRMSENRLEVR